MKRLDQPGLHRGEPWHVRWVGRPLAAHLQARGYLESGYPTTDDLLLAIESLIADHVLPH